MRNVEGEGERKREREGEEGREGGRERGREGGRERERERKLLYNFIAVTRSRSSSGIPRKGIFSSSIFSRNKNSYS